MLSAALLMPALFTGCAHPAALQPANSARLTAHPEFAAAAKAAPAWAEEALNTVWLLEHDTRAAAPFGIDYSHAAASAAAWQAAATTSQNGGSQ